METTSRLSVAIITYNEEKNIARCLESVKDIADEIIIVDSYSTDQTKSIAQSYHVRWVEHPFHGHVQQKNYALSLATYPMVLSLDADEALSNELKQSIQNEKKHFQHMAYSMNRLSYYCGKWIKHSGWYPDKKIRLVNKHYAEWGGDNPHDKLIPRPGTPVKHLNGDILHYTYYTISEHVRQTDYFTNIAANVAYQKGKRSNIFLILFSPVHRFIKMYFIKMGFLDGYYGFVVCAIQAFSNFLKYTKLFELQRKNKN
ncbi:MAG: glycosyltransferase family 2 protein [Cytophagaceae bacterium]|nr:glycosyltransferase family 2 protein [Cytophagaceae bacterium]MDW8456669.1 glycosyltransferase family 2 protein [Cytophagaceae bacterium]